MSDRVELCIPADPQLVGLARHVVVAAARKAGMNDERSEDLRIAVSEATTNAILAQQQSGVDEPIVLTFGRDDEDGFVVTIVDAGPGFDPGQPIDLERRDWSLESGLGVTILRGLADEVEFVREEGMRVNLRFAVGMST